MLDPSGAPTDNETPPPSAVVGAVLLSVASRTVSEETRNGSPMPETVLPSVEVPKTHELLCALLTSRKTSVVELPLMQSAETMSGPAAQSG
jgi:hypothetical protein